MKIREIRNHLTQTEYVFQNVDGNLIIGHQYLPELLKLDSETFKVTPSSILEFDESKTISQIENHFKSLFIIYDELKELVKDKNLIVELLNGNDEVVSNPEKYWKLHNGVISEVYCEKDNKFKVDNTGVLFCPTTHFKSKKEANEFGIQKYVKLINHHSEQIVEIQTEANRKIDERNKAITILNQYLLHLKSQSIDEL